MYGRQYGRGGDIQRFFRRDGAPLTMGILVANVVTFFVCFALIGSPGYGAVLYEVMAFTTKTFPLFFWTAVTWPLIAYIPLITEQLIGFLFSLMFFFWIGGSLERSWGTRVFGGFMAATSAITVLTLYLGSLLFHVPMSADGLYLASAAPMVAWAAMNRREVINVYGILPVPAPILAWVTVGLTWFTYSMRAGNPLFGIFAVSGCAAAYWYVAKARYAYNGFRQYRTDDRANGFSVFNIFKSKNDTKREKPGNDEDKPQDGGMNPLRRMKEERERKEREKRLEDMFRRSGYSDEEPKDR